MTVFEEIFKFSLTRDLWQQDVLRRLCCQEDFTEQDFGDSFKMLKDHYSLLPKNAAPTPIALKDTHTPYTPYRIPKIILNSIGDIKHTDQLAPEQTLHFAIDGLTIAYSDNGCGKSGYCKLLKRICRVRKGADENICGNVYEAEKHPPAEAILMLTEEGGKPQPFSWCDGSVKDQMSSISVFDGKTIPIYANQQNEIEFLPHGLDILPQLGDICKKLSAKLDQEAGDLKKQLEFPLPTFPKDTKVASLVSKLSIDIDVFDLPSKQQLEELGRWGKTDEDKLSAIRQALGTDPDTLAKRSRRLKEIVLSLKEEFAGLEQQLGDLVSMSAKEKIEVAIESRRASNLAAEEAFKDVPLKGVGSEPWRLMFDYAREYSKVAYPYLPFPVTGKGKLCLLCQQPLSDDASNRFIRFDLFVKDKAQSEAIRLEKERDALKSSIISITPRPPSEASNLLGDIEEICPSKKELVIEARAYLEHISKRRSQILEVFNNPKNIDKVLPLPKSPVTKLESIAEKLELQAKAYEKTKDSEERKGLESKYNELEARKKLSDNIDLVITKLAGLFYYHGLMMCKKGCETSSISRKNTELRRQYITKDFEKKLMEEIQQFGLSYLPLKVEEHTDYGASYIGVGLEAKRKIQNKEVLSEGEFTALALACFFTEIDSIPGQGAIILDDPVSSLDHLRTRRVAKRLVDEAVKGRQVIVFTHDLVFYYELRIFAAEKNCPIVTHWVRHTKEKGFGTIFENEEPWQAKKVKARISDLEKKLINIAALHDQDSEIYRNAVKDFYSDLRETWERLVEELLLNNVVTRFQAEVMTRSLKGCQVKDEDYSKIYFGMKRASEYSGHDRSVGRQVSFPPPDEIKQDLEKLREYAGELKTRRKNLEDKRRSLEGPPQGKFM